MENNKERIIFFKIKQNFTTIFKMIKLVYKIKKSYFWLIILLAILNGLMPIITLQCTQRLINLIQNNFGVAFETLIVAFLYLAFFSIVQDIFGVLYEYFTGLYQAKIIYDLNEVILEKANKLSLTDFEDSDVYDKVSRAKEEINYTPFNIFASVLSLISSCVTLIASVGILISWKSWVVLLLVFSPIISAYNYFRLGEMQYKLKRNRATRVRKAWYYNFLGTSDVGAKEIRLYNLGGYFVKRYKDINKGFYAEDEMMSKQIGILNTGFKLISQILSDIAVFIVLRAAFLGEILIGHTMSYIKAISMVQGNAEAILTTTFGLYNSSLFAGQFFEFLDIEEEEKQGSIKISKIRKIEFKNVSFKYPETDRLVLNNLSFIINENDKIALVGENGCGKSTLVKLISRLYKPISGQILINDIDINEIDIESYQERIGVMFQDFNKYELTAGENIGLGDTSKIEDFSAIERASHKADILEYINKLPEKFESQLGLWFENGTQLSGGQWQKIALARAFFRAADIYILDEPSSFLDPRAESDLFRRLRDLIGGKMSIFITHRLSNVMYADLILVMDEGEFKEAGEFEFLMHRKGKFYELYNIQKDEKMIV